MLWNILKVKMNKRIDFESILVLLFMWFFGIGFVCLGSAMIYGGITNQLESVLFSMLIGISMFGSGLLLIIYPIRQALKKRDNASDEKY